MNNLTMQQKDFLDSLIGLARSLDDKNKAYELVKAKIKLIYRLTDHEYQEVIDYIKNELGV